MKYDDHKDGEWIEPQAGYKAMCCDCSLVHRMEFRVVKGKIQFRVWRDYRATAAARRKPKQHGKA